MEQQFALIFRVEEFLLFCAFSLIRCMVGHIMQRWQHSSMLLALHGVGQSEVVEGSIPGMLLLKAWPEEFFAEADDGRCEGAVKTC